MKRLLVDMDGVLADVYAQFLKYEKENGIHHNLEDLYGVTEENAFGRIHEYVNSERFFIEAPVMANSQRVLEQLNQKYDLFIVSSATEFPNSLTQKMFWLIQHFPFIEWKQVVLCGTKQVIKGDIMLDDHFKNLDYFDGEKTLLYTQPHNIYADCKHHQRVNSWQEVADVLL